MDTKQQALKAAIGIGMKPNTPTMSAGNNVPLISLIKNRFSPIQQIKVLKDYVDRKNYLELGVGGANPNYTAPTPEQVALQAATTGGKQGSFYGGGTFEKPKYAPMPASSNPWAGKSINEIRNIEYARSPGMKPLEAAVSATGPIGNTQSTLPPNVMTYLKDYVAQMRAAGYSDMAIKQNLLKTGSIQIPNKLPENFGQNKWATGMNAEFGRTNLVPQTLEGNMPNPNEYQNYQPGNIANRLPSYSEATGQQEQPQLYNQSGQFSQNKSSGLMAALQNYMNNYQGKTVPFSQGMAEAGMVGLPQDLANSWMPEYSSIQNQKVANAKEVDSYRALAEKYPQAGITPADTFETSIQKINDSIGQKDIMPDVLQQQKISEIYSAAVGGASLSEIIMGAMYRGLKLSDTEIQAIYDAAQAEIAAQQGE